jgi:hypothetical protein
VIVTEAYVQGIKETKWWRLLGSVVVLVLEKQL